jgi:hypothetical protein
MGQVATRVEQLLPLLYEQLAYRKQEGPVRNVPAAREALGLFL